jgi:hypothetical protein
LNFRRLFTLNNFGNFRQLGFLRNMVDYLKSGISRLSIDYHNMVILIILIVDWIQSSRYLVLLSIIEGVYYNTKSINLFIVIQIIDILETTFELWAQFSIMLVQNFILRRLEQENRFQILCFINIIFYNSLSLG